MWAKLHPALVITRREVHDQLRDWRIVAPIVLLTIFFPGLLNFTAGRLSTFVQQYGAPIIGDRLVPFLLMMVGFFPATISLVIALESFVGEKERRTLEPLLTSPLEDWQLYLGKLISSLVAPLIGSYLGTFVYLFGVARQIGWQPPPTLLIQVLALATVQALVMISGAVVISSQTTSTRAANVLASFVIVPMALLIEGESLIMFYGQYDLLWWSILGQLVLAGLLMRMGIAKFNREDLLGRQIDSLDLRWGWQTFRTALLGKPRKPWHWWRDEIPSSLRRLALPGVLMGCILIAGFFTGEAKGSSWNISALPNSASLQQQLSEALHTLPLFSAETVPVLWLHNLRAILIATLLGAFSFGILGVMVIMLPLFLAGFFAASVAGAGLTPAQFLLAFIAPHGLVEIPALILAGAAILRLGATLVSPARGQTIGESFLLALADWAKIFFGLVVPLLLVSAAIEALITPQIARLILGG